METKITFEEYLRKENLSENTITSYLWTVNYFNVNYDVVSKENLLAYKGYEEIKAYVAEHNDGMKVSNLYIAQVKAKYGIIERENYNKPKSDDARQPKCPKEKEEAIVEALKAFKMI